MELERHNTSEQTTFPPAACNLELGDDVVVSVNTWNEGWASIGGSEHSRALELTVLVDRGKPQKDVGVISFLSSGTA